MTRSEDSKQILPWELISSSMALDEPWFPVRKDVVRLPSGETVDDYLVWESPNIAFVAPYTSHGTFILCEQYRHAVGKTLLQFPAGGIDKGKNGAAGETPAEAARRELEEETGYVSSELKLLATVAPYPTKVTCLNYLFLATNARPEGVIHNDAMEQTRVVEKSPDELKSMLHDGSIQVAGSLALALLALNELGL